MKKKINKLEKLYEKEKAERDKMLKKVGGISPYLVGTPTYYDTVKDGIIKLEFYSKPNIWGRIKIRFWKALLFPMVNIIWTESNEKD